MIPRLTKGEFMTIHDRNNRLVIKLYQLLSEHAGLPTFFACRTITTVLACQPTKFQKVVGSNAAPDLLSQKSTDRPERPR